MINKVKYSALIIVITLAFCLIVYDSFATQWAKTYGKGVGSHQQAFSIQQTSDGGHIVGGFASDDLWVMKLSSDGTINWQKIYDEDGDFTSNANSIKQTIDGGYIVAGRNATSLWVLKLDSSGSINWQKAFMMRKILPVPIPSSRPQMGVIL